MRTLFVSSPSHIIQVLCMLMTLGASSTLISCSNSMQPKDFANQTPTFDVMAYYTGHTQSSGLIESRSGKPLKRVKTETWGRMENGELIMTQDLTFHDKAPDRRTWTIRRLDEHRYEARTEKMIGPSEAESWGNTARLNYILALKPGNPMMNVRMTHWMQLQPDGKTMLNTVTVKKWGIVIARITEVFRKDFEPN